MDKVNIDSYLLSLIGECTDINKCIVEGLKVGLDGERNGSNVTIKEDIVFSYYQLVGIIERLQGEGILPKYDDACIGSIVHNRLKEIE